MYHVDIDAFKGTRYKLKLNVGDPNTMSELDSWMLFFPCECIDDVLNYTNSNLHDRMKRITKGELYKVIGILYAMNHPWCIDAAARLLEHRRGSLSCSCIQT